MKKHSCCNKMSIKCLDILLSISENRSIVQCFHLLAKEIHYWLLYLKWGYKIKTVYWIQLFPVEKLHIFQSTYENYYKFVLIYVQDYFSKINLSKFNPIEIKNETKIKTFSIQHKNVKNKWSVSSKLIKYFLFFHEK